MILKCGNKGLGENATDELKDISNDLEKIQDIKV